MGSHSVFFSFFFSLYQRTTFLLASTEGVSSLTGFVNISCSSEELCDRFASAKPQTLTRGLEKHRNEILITAVSGHLRSMAHPLPFRAGTVCGSLGIPLAD